MTPSTYTKSSTVYAAPRRASDLMIDDQLRDLRHRAGVTQRERPSIEHLVTELLVTEH